MLPLILMLACADSPSTNSDDSATTPAGPADTFDGTLSSLAEETARHGQSVYDATDMPGVSDAEGAYWSRCHDYWDTMNRCMDSFMGCDMMGGGSSWDDWSSWMHDMWDQMQAHHDAMAGCMNMTDCHDRETAWQKQMADMFDQMNQLDPAWTDDCGWCDDCGW